MFKATLVKEITVCLFRHIL